MINPKRIILCVDIDDTIMNSDDDINGDAIAWVNALTKIQTYCEERSFQFLVQIITAKDFADIRVMNVFAVLHSFLLPLNKQGKVILPFVDPTEGYDASDIRLYFMHHKNQTKYWTSADLGLYSVTEEELLPPIHLCRYNVIPQEKFNPLAGRKSYSKALVMQYIAKHFHETTPPENIFLLDDQRFNINDCEQNLYGYQGISAESLFLLAKGSKADRTTACYNILTTLENRIKARVDFILANEHSSLDRQTSEKTPIVQPHAIHFAVKERNLERVRELVTQNPDLVHATDAFNQTPLLWAASEGYHEIVMFLIEKGASVNQATQLPDNGCHQKTHHNTPLDWAIISKHSLTIDVLLRAGAVSHYHPDSALISLLIKHNNITQVQAWVVRNKSLLNQLDKMGYTPLHYAALFGQVDIARYLINEGADVNISTSRATNQYIRFPNQTAIDLACQTYHDSMVNFLFESGAAVIPSRYKKRQVIHVFAQQGRLNDVQTMIDRYPEILEAGDQFNQTPLIWAAAKGHNEIVKFLIHKGAEVDRYTYSARNNEENFRHALDWAMVGNHIETLLSLIDAGATAHYTYTTLKNKTLKTLIQENDCIAVRILIKCNEALLTQYDSDGYTPLHYAAIYGHIGLVHILIVSGAKINMMTASHLTATELWSLYQPTQTNPFNRYDRLEKLEKRKTEIITLITAKIPNTMWSWCANFRNATRLESLKQQVLQAAFESTDSIHKTADDVLTEIIDAWEQEQKMEEENSYSYVNNLYSFFSPTNDSSSSTVKVLQEIRTTLCQNSKTHQKTALNDPLLTQSEHSRLHLLGHEEQLLKTFHKP